MSTAPTALASHDVPTLWARAKAMFAVVLASITSTLDLARRISLARVERRQLMQRLVPVEKLVRSLMLVEAATFLLMTPEGRRLRAETAKIAPPGSAPAQAAQTQPSTRILLPGWQTLAACHPYIDPRIVEREQREQREALARHLTDIETQTRGCRFNVLHWVHDKHDAHDEAPPPQPARRFLPMSETNYPLVRGITVLDDMPRKPQRVLHDNAADSSTKRLARRIEALARILANPASAIRRLAHRLASFTADVLGDFELSWTPTRDWHHGVPEFRAADLHHHRLCRALIATHKHDPG